VTRDTTARQPAVSADACPSADGSIWSLTDGQRLRYLAAIGAMAIGTLFLLPIPLVIKQAPDSLAAGGADWLRTLLPAALGVVGLHSLHGQFTYLRARWAADASAGIVRDCDIVCMSTLSDCRPHTTIRPTPETSCNAILKTSKPPGSSWPRKWSRSRASRCS
jgi:hypothetical protein